jgi:sugar phosphate isomerase/epimerase
MKSKVSVGSSAFAFGAYASRPIPLEKVAERLQELNFQGIELLGARPYGHPDDYPALEDRKKLQKMFKNHGLEISNYGADFEGSSPASNDPGERTDFRRLFTKNLTFCADCEIPSIRVDTIHEPPLPSGVTYEDAWSRISSAWHECAEEAEKEGVLVVWEFEPGFMFNKPHGVVKMVNDVDHRNFKVMFDTCHAHMCSVVGAKQTEPVDKLQGGEVELAKLLKGKIGYVHLIDSDNTLHDNWTSTHAPFGKGVINFDAVLQAILEAGYSRDDWWTIDLCFWPQAWEILAESKVFVDNLLKKHGII